MKKYFLLFILFFILKTPSQAQQTVGLFFNNPDAFNGYTLFPPSSSKITYLIDNCGELINSWESNYFPGASAYLLENGNLIRTGRISSDFQGGGTGGRIEIFSWEGDLIWGYNYSSDIFHHHHDIAVMPNGNILLLAWDLRTNTEMVQSGRDPNNTPPQVWNEKIVELEPLGTDSAAVIWEWFIFDHLVQDFDSTKNNYGVIAEHPELLNINYGPPGSPLTGVDWIHFNAINYNPTLDQIIVSSRHLSEIMIIDHSTTTAEAAGHTGGNSGKGGDILFRWGNPQSYDRGSPEDKKLFGPHDAQWIEDGLLDEGKIMIFNNGPGRPNGNFSTIDVIAPPIDTNGNYLIEPNQPFAPENLHWIYSANPPTAFYSSNISGAQRLPNGNTLICEGRRGRFFEVNNSGTILWQYLNPVTSSGPIPQGVTPTNNSSFRAYRYDPDFSAFNGKDLTPQGPIEIDPLSPTCMITTNVNSIEFDPEIGILKNPVQDNLQIENPNSETLQIGIFDLTGQMMSSRKSTDSRIVQDVSNFKNGIYFVRIFIVEKNLFFTKKIVKQN